MEAIQTDCFWLEQESSFEVLMAKKCKQYEIYWRMRDVYEEACFSQKSLQMGKI